MFTPEQNGSFTARALALFVLIAVMWIVRAVSAIIPDHALSAGIVPREVTSLVSILTAPFVHVSFRHLIANSIPLFVLGTLVLLRGLTEFMLVVLLSILIGGAGTWLLGTSGSLHVGASGIVLGLMGYLLFRSAFDRKISSIVITLVVAFGYGTALALSLVPREDISWSAISSDCSEASQQHAFSLAESRRSGRARKRFSRYPIFRSLSPERGPTLRSRRHAAVCWPGASAPRASQVRVAVWSERGGRVRLSERTFGGPRKRLNARSQV